MTDTPSRAMLIYQKSEILVFLSTMMSACQDSKAYHHLVEAYIALNEEINVLSKGI